MIIGAGGHAQVVADILLRSHEVDPRIQPIGYLDDNSDLHGQSLVGLPVLGSVADISTIDHAGVIVAVGDNLTRSRLYDLLTKKGEHLVTARHPTAVIAPDVRVGPGTMICAGVIVNPGTVVGADVILNTACTVDHHGRIGDHVHLAPGAHLGGEVQVGEGVLVGIGATIMPRRRLGPWCIAGAGALVHEDVHDGTTVVGVPARTLESTKRKGESPVD